MSGTGRARAAGTALVAIVAITAAWWALALWPVGSEAPEWLLRTRQVCFGSNADTLPSAAGWLLLIGQPASMIMLLVMVWGEEVREAFLATPGDPELLHVFEWSGWQQQVVRQDWTPILGPADLDRVAAALAAQERSFDLYPTAVGFAMLYGARALEAQAGCRERKLDLSGDGTNNDGVAPEVARRDDPMQGITVNGLVIGANVATLARYYRQFVIQGPGAFVEVAEDYEDFEQAMRRKLLRELGLFEISEGAR